MISGAAGTYMTTLDEDADISTDLMIEPGQAVVVSGDQGLADAPSWGSGGFVVRQFGSLVLAQMQLAGSISVISGGSVVLESVGGSIFGLTVTNSSFRMDTTSTATLGGMLVFDNYVTVELSGKTILSGSLLVVTGASVLSLENCIVYAVSGWPLRTFFLF